MLKECLGATQKGPNGSLRREQTSDREIGINAWRGGAEGLEEWGACSFKLGNPSPMPRLSLLLTLWAAKSPRPGRWRGDPFLFVSTLLPCDVMAGVGSSIPGF